VLSDAEVPLFWQAFGDAGLPGVALQVLLLTGQRPGEVAHMRREHVADGWWTLPGAPEPATEWLGTKNSQTHRVWLCARVRDMLAPGNPLATFRWRLFNLINSTSGLVVERSTMGL
jgi:integrase